MEHRFYRKSRKEQTKIQTIIAVSAAAVLLPMLLLGWNTGNYLPALFSFAILLSIVAPFFDTPALRKSGQLIYHSPLFLTERPKNGVIKVHGGTLFDYFFTIEQSMSGNKRLNLILQKYLEGLLSLMEEYGSENANLKVRGTTYIMNERTLKKIGFRLLETDPLQKLLLCFNYFNLLISISMAKKKLSFPSLTNTRTFEADMCQLLEHKEYITELNTRLKRSAGPEELTDF